VAWQQQPFNKRKNNIPDFEASSRENGNPKFSIHCALRNQTLLLMLEFLNASNLNIELVGIILFLIANFQVNK